MPFSGVSGVRHATALGGRGAQRAGPPLPQQHSFSLTFLKRVRSSGSCAAEKLGNPGGDDI